MYLSRYELIRETPAPLVAAITIVGAGLLGTLLIGIGGDSPEEFGRFSVNFDSPGAPSQVEFEEALTTRSLVFAELPKTGAPNPDLVASAGFSNGRFYVVGAAAGLEKSTDPEDEEPAIDTVYMYDGMLWQHYGLYDEITDEVFGFSSEEKAAFRLGWPFGAEEGPTVGFRDNTGYWLDEYDSDGVSGVKLVADDGVSTQTWALSDIAVGVNTSDYRMSFLAVDDKGILIASRSRDPKKISDLVSFSEDGRTWYSKSLRGIRVAGVAFSSEEFMLLTRYDENATAELKVNLAPVYLGRLEAIRSD